MSAGAGGMGEVPGFEVRVTTHLCKALDPGTVAETPEGKHLVGALALDLIDARALLDAARAERDMARAMPPMPCSPSHFVAESILKDTVLQAVRERDAATERAIAAEKRVAFALLGKVPEDCVVLLKSAWMALGESQVHLRERSSRADELLREAQDALRHAAWCRECGEGSWEDCEGGREAIAVEGKIDAHRKGGS